MGRLTQEGKGRAGGMPGGMAGAVHCIAGASRGKQGQGRHRCTEDATQTANSKHKEQKVRAWLASPHLAGGCSFQ